MSLAKNPFYIRRAGLIDREGKAQCELELVSIERKRLQSECPHPVEFRVTHPRKCAEADEWDECLCCGKELTWRDLARQHGGAR